MGVDTHLYLNTRWDLRDILRVIERIAKEKPIVESEHSFAPGYFTLHLKKRERMIHCHTYIKTPLGSATMLDMSANDESHEIFKGIAEVLGGIFMDNDIDGNCEMINGAMNEDDGLPYFIKYAITEDGITNEDINGFLKSMSQWYDKCDSSKKPHELKTLLRNSEKC